MSTFFTPWALFPGMSPSVGLALFQEALVTSGVQDPSLFQAIEAHNDLFELQPQFQKEMRGVIEKLLAQPQRRGYLSTASLIAGNLSLFANPEEVPHVTYGILAGRASKWKADILLTSAADAREKSMKGSGEKRQSTVKSPLAGQRLESAISKGNAVVSNWLSFPEVQRILKDAQPSLAFFDELLLEKLEELKPFYGKDLWVDPEARLGGMSRISSAQKEVLIRSGRAQETEFYPLDATFEWLTLHLLLLQESRLNLYARLAISAIAILKAEPGVEEEYAAELSLWMSRYGISYPFDSSKFTQENLDDLENRLLAKYPQWRLKIKNQEWAEAELRKINPGLVGELKQLKGLSDSSVSEASQQKHREFSYHLGQTLGPLVRKHGWIAPLVEWCFVAYASFLKAR